MTKHLEFLPLTSWEQFEEQELLDTDFFVFEKDHIYQRRRRRREVKRESDYGEKKKKYRDYREESGGSLPNPTIEEIEVIEKQLEARYRKLLSPAEPPGELIKIVRFVDQELVKYVKGNPKIMHEFMPRQFEEFVAEILSSFG